MFSSGYDIGDIPDDVFAEEAERLVAHPFTAALDALDACEVPTVAALPGHTIGGGLELALACDLRVAADGILLGMPPAKLGLVYSHTGLRRFLDAIGAPRTRELFLTARNIDARTALGWGLVNQVVGVSELESVALDLAEDLAANAPLQRARQQARDPRAAGRRGRSSTPRSSASSSSCARRASTPRTCARACARSARSARRAGRAAERPASIRADGRIVDRDARRRRWVTDFLNAASRPPRTLRATSTTCASPTASSPRAGPRIRAGGWGRATSRRSTGRSGRAGCVPGDASTAT